MVTIAFGHWLAGLADGEGCFGIYPSNRGYPGFRFLFAVTLRADDERLLEECRDITGCGSVGTNGPAKPGQSPCLTWRVTALGDCMLIARIFEKYPLRSRKAEAFEIWARALRAHPDHNRVADLKNDLATAVAFT